MRSRKPAPRNVEPTQARVTRHVRQLDSVPRDFDWQIYLDNNADLRRAGIHDEPAATRHFLRYGHTENRIYSQAQIGTPHAAVRYENVGIPHWLKESLALKRGVVFTCLAGEYDSLKEPNSIDPNWDYVCFTDLNIKSKVWKIVPIPAELNTLIPAKKARAIKILPHRYLPEYDMSVWVDASIQIKRAVTEFVAHDFKEGDVFAISKHPDRVCIYTEGEAVKKMYKDRADVVDAQMNKYRAERYPNNWGLVQSGVIIRKKTEEVIDFCERWWQEVFQHSRRDQLSFNYVLWKKSIPIVPLHARVFCSQFFHLYSHSKNGRAVPVKFRSNYGSLQNYINGKAV